MTIAEKIAQENPVDMPIVDTGYFKFLESQHAKGLCRWQHILDMREYLESKGFVYGVDRLPSQTFNTLRTIESYAFMLIRRPELEA